MQPGFLQRLYINVVVTISIIIAVLVFYAFRTAEQAEAETEALLHLILPSQVADRLKDRPGEPISDSFGDASVLFSDLVGFVAIARSLGAERTVEMLNHLVQQPRPARQRKGRRQDQDDRRRLYGRVRRAEPGARRREAARADGAQDAGRGGRDRRSVRADASASDRHRVRTGDGGRHRHGALQLRHLGRRGEPCRAA